MDAKKDHAALMVDMKDGDLSFNDKDCFQDMSDVLEIHN